MNDLLELSRGEYVAAKWFTDEEIGQIVNVSEEVSKPRFERFMELRSNVQQLQTDVKMRYLTIGWILTEIERDKLYYYVAPKKAYQDVQGYSNFYDFCKDVFGLKKTTAARMVAVAKEYGGVSESGEFIGVHIQYVNYSYSQLASMLPIEEKYRTRIPVTCPCRKIDCLAKLYRDYVPLENKTYEDDLKVWAEKAKKEKAAKNANKKKIDFVPASVPTLEPSKFTSMQGENADDDEFDGEDERDISTSTEQKKIPFEHLCSGLERQLELLKEHYPEWKNFCNMVGLTFLSKDPTYADASAKKSYKSGKAKKLDKKLNLKNEKERKEWLSKFREWGIWLDVPEVNKRFYRYDFANGTSMIVEIGLEYWSYSTTKVPHEKITYAVFDNDYKKYDSNGMGVSKAVEWLTKHGKEI